MQEIADQELPRSMASDWTELAYLQTAGRQHGDVFLRPGGGVRLPGAGGAVRELEAAAGRDPGGADVPVLLGRGRAAGRHGSEHLHADRLRGAGGPGEQERHPDRRVRQAAAGGGRPRARGHAGGLPAAPAADPDDLVRLHPRRGAAGDRQAAPAPRCASRWVWPSSAACSA